VILSDRKQRPEGEKAKAVINREQSKVTKINIFNKKKKEKRNRNTCIE